MKALGDYFLMVVFTLLLNRVQFLIEKHGSEKVKDDFDLCFQSLESHPC